MIIDPCQRPDLTPDQLLELHCVDIKTERLTVVGEEANFVAQAMVGIVIALISFWLLLEPLDISWIPYAWLGRDLINWVIWGTGLVILLIMYGPSLWEALF